MDILPLILLILFAVIKGSSKKQKDAARRAKERNSFEEANQFVSRNMAVPKQENFAAESGEYGEYGKFEAGPPMEGTAPQAPAPFEKRRPAAAARPAAAPAEAPKEKNLGWGSLQGFTSNEGECAPDHLHGGTAGSTLDLAGRYDSAFEPAFDQDSDGFLTGDKPSRAGKRPSLVFAQNPAVNGIIWSEVLKRPQKRRG